MAKFSIAPCPDRVQGERGVNWARDFLSLLRNLSFLVYIADFSQKSELFRKKGQIDEILG